MPQPKILIKIMLWWKSKDEFIYGRASVGQQARTYIHQLSAMDEKNRLQERTRELHPINMTDDDDDEEEEEEEEEKDNICFFYYLKYLSISFFTGVINSKKRPLK